jgi:translation initiation factor IF-2
VVTDTAKAKQIVIFREPESCASGDGEDQPPDAGPVAQADGRKARVKELPVIIKTDVGGSAEVLTETLQKLSNDKVKVRVISLGRGRDQRVRRAAGVGVERDHYRIQRAAGA